MLRSQVIKLLHQKGSIGEASNGMDMALCIIDFKTGLLEYAGANNPIYIVRSDKTLEVIKADRMPIGIHINCDKSFSKTVSKLYNASAGSHELSLGLQFACHPKKKRFRTLKCPSF